MVRPTVILHVGTRKSGTTFLQLALRSSREALAAQGVQLTVSTQDDFDLVPPLRQAALPQEIRAAAAALVERVGRAAAEGPLTHIVSLEALAEMPPPVVEAIVSLMRHADFDLKIVLTARHWGAAIPSEWQQQVKERSVQSYEDFLAAVRDRRAEAQLFLDRQHLPGVVRRWAAAAGLDSVHVIACPRPHRGDLLGLFCGVAGVDRAELSPPGRAIVNNSLSLAQAEALRRVNVALGPRLPRSDGSYKEAVRLWMTGANMAGERSPIRLPAAFAPWCAAEARQQHEELRDLGVDIVGDAEDLLLPADLPTGPAWPPEEEVAAVAIGTMATLAHVRWREVADVGPASDLAAVAASERASEPPESRRPQRRRLFGR